MKVIAINGSPRKKGNTKAALEIMSDVFKSKNIDFEIIEVGNKPLSGCIACGGCIRNMNEKCVLPDAEPINNAIVRLKEADGIILSSPVHYSNMGGTAKAFMDRLFYVVGVNGGLLRNKVGASVVAVRRTGGSFTFSALNNYLTISEIIVASSSYWNVAHGTEPGEVVHDSEAVQTLELLAENMVWLMSMIEATKDSIPKPPLMDKVMMNFIR